MEPIICLLDSHPQSDLLKEKFNLDDFLLRYIPFIPSLSILIRNNDSELMMKALGRMTHSVYIPLAYRKSEILQRALNNRENDLDEEFIEDILTESDEMEEMLSTDRELALSAVKRFGLLLRSVGQKFANDREIVWEAIKNRGESLIYASESLRKEREFVLKAAQNIEHFALNNVMDFKEDREIVWEAVKRNGSNIVYADQSFCSDRELILEAGKTFRQALNYANEEIREDREVVLQMVKMNGSALCSVPRLFKSDREIVMEAVKSNGSAIQFADESLKSDREIALQAISSSVYAFYFVSKQFRKDKYIALTAVTKLGSCLFDVGESLKEDMEIVTAAIKNEGQAILHTKFTNDRDLAWMAVKKRGNVLPLLPFFKGEREFVLEAIKNGMPLNFAMEPFKADREIVTEAVKRNGGAIKYAHISLQTDKEIVVVAMRNYALLSCNKEWLQRLEYLGDATKCEMIRDVSTNPLSINDNPLDVLNSFESQEFAEELVELTFKTLLHILQ